jgi:hypothetical protein
MIPVAIEKKKERNKERKNQTHLINCVPELSVFGNWVFFLLSSEHTLSV